MMGFHLGCHTAPASRRGRVLVRGHGINAGQGLVSNRARPDEIDAGLILQMSLTRTNR